MKQKISILALGKAGSKIAKAFDGYAANTFYINSHKEEMDLLEGNYFIPGEEAYDGENAVKLCVDGAGTGRSPNLGQKLANKHRESVFDFISHAFEGYKGIVLVTVGGGGGSGTGFAPVVAEILEELRIKFGFIYTLPLKSEGSPAIPNAANGLNNLVSVLKGTRVAPFFLFDNELMLSEIGEGHDDYWEIINERIAKIMMFTDLLNEDSTDITSFNTFDEREFNRIFRLVKGGNDIGFNDIKSFGLDVDNVAESFKLGMKETSMTTMKGYEYPSAAGLLVVVERPRLFDNDDNTAITELFDLISRKYKGKTMLKSVVKTDAEVHTVNILFSGMNTPTFVNKFITQAKKLLETGKRKRDAKARVSAVKFDDDFSDFE